MIHFVPFPEWISPAVVPGLPFRWYGVMYLLAFAVTYLLFLHEIRRRDPSVDRERVADFFFWVVLGLLLGARIYYVLAFDGGAYLSRPWLIVWPFSDGKFTGIQGMSYHGGLIGAIIAAGIYARIRGVDLLLWGDVLAVSAPLGYTLGRLGNFTNGELVGRTTTVAWGVMFPNARRYSATEPWVQDMAGDTGVEIADAGQMVNLPRHPSQLYEGFLEGILLWLVLWLVFRRSGMFRGALIALYLVGYGAARLMAGYFRETNEAVGFLFSRGTASDNSAMVGSALQITEGQVYSLLMIVAGVILAVVFRVRHRPPPVVETFEDPAPETGSQTE